MTVEHTMTKRIPFMILLILLFIPLLNWQMSSQEIDHLAAAQKLFQSGHFAESQAEFHEALTAKGPSFDTYRGLGILSVLGNQLDTAEAFLKKAAELKPDEPLTKAYLAEMYYRRRDFAHAAPLFRTLGAESAALKLESFKGVTPYQVEGDVQSTTIKFVNTDPLPVVMGRVNNSDEINLLIDTGGGEFILDPEFAKTVGARQFGTDGGQGRIDSLKLGDFTIRNIPISVLDVRRFAAAAGGRKIDGIIGTVLLSEFLATLDYSNQQLVLQRKEPKSNGKGDGGGIPFWLAGDHFIVAWGKVNDVKELLFVDTGLAGAGFTCPESTLKELSIKVGGEEEAKPIRFVLDELALGSVSEQRVVSLFGPFPAALETRFGFRIGGLISHEFFRNDAVTFDFDTMQLRLKKP
jgi:Aspartyl protease